jgi:hypothetical protein
MNRNFNKRLKSFLTLLVLVLSGCSDFLDINKDPNNPLDSRLDQVLPTVQTVIAEALGNGGGGMSDLTSQLVHQTVQRNNSNFYFIGGNEFNISNAWSNLFAGALMDLEIMMSKAAERESWHYLGVAQTLKAYSFSMAVDMWGDVPYTEFGKGTDVPFPSFDKGQDIYPMLLELLDEASANLKKEAAESPGNDDLMYGGDIGSWLKLANSIKLKLYNQLRLTPLYDGAKVEAIIAGGELMDQVSGGFKLLYTSSNNPENRHPLFIQDYVQNNANYIDPYFYLIMAGDGRFNSILEGITDPRMRYYFYNQLAGDEPQNPPTTARFGDFLSIWFASLNIDPNEGFDQAQSQTLVGLYPAGGAYDDLSGRTGGVGNNQNPGLGGAGYQRLYPYFAHLYTRAELSLTKGVTGDPRQLFEAAIRASFAEVNELAPIDITSDAIDAYVSAVLEKYDAASNQKKLELIITQKWIASFGFSVDSYTDYRRTGYPVMFNPATDNNPFTILNRAYPLSIPYFVSDLQINPNAAAQRNPASDRVFWDVD